MSVQIIRAYKKELDLCLQKWVCEIVWTESRWFVNFQLEWLDNQSQSVQESIVAIECNRYSLF